MQTYIDSVMETFGYMDSWKRFDETSLPKKEDFYSNLSMEDIADVIIIMQKSMEKLWNKQSMWVSWLVHSEWYIITSRCIWNFSK